ncbi:MAG: family 43 glycosylhydrolase, partial [Kiritimatiellae bacterium]|nr:family 43 glycosylhydrolase [Kiritimatiellia bacterium]
VDNGGTWEHVPLGLNGAEDDGKSDVIDYAPTIVKHRGKYYLVGSMGLLHAGDSPTGPWTKLGKMKIPSGEADGVAIAHFWDPMLFSDDDGRLYLYWGCTATQGIWGVELDPENPLEYTGEAKHLIAFEPEECPWEKMYGWDFDNSWIEGPWMVKIDGRYHLTYSAGGADPRYAISSATGESALGPFEKQKNNPVYFSREGVVTGTGHGSIAKGPDGEYWVAACVMVCRNHMFERMVSFDRIGYDKEKREFVPTKATAVPQYLPQTGRRGGAYAPLSGRTQKGRGAISDGELKSSWTARTLPATADIVFGKTKTFCAFRLVWRDVGLDEARGVAKGPYRYRVWARSGGEWTVVSDNSANDRDMFVDYREIGPVEADAVRLEILGGPEGISPAVAEFTPFGTISVACIGDSITEGYLLERKDLFSYPAQLQTMLGDAYEVRNFGNPGKGVTMYPYIDTSEYAAAKEFRPDVVICNLGANDWIGLDEARYADEYLKILEPFKGARIIIWTPLAPITPKHGCYASPTIAKVDELNREVALRAGAETIDMFSPLAGREDEAIMDCDGVHPNEKGCEIIAGACFEKLTGFAH